MDLQPVINFTVDYNGNGLQEAPDSNQLCHHVYSRSLKAFEAGDRDRDAVCNLQQLLKRQDAIRIALMQAIGGLPDYDQPLNPQLRGTLRFANYRVEKLLFESRPGVLVSSNLYLPNDIDEPRGAVLFVCGHYEEGKQHPEYHYVCDCMAKAGLIVLALDPIGQGERLSYTEPDTGQDEVGWGTSEHEYAGIQCWPVGDGIARYFLHDISRAVDYLCSCEEVDKSKIGITGNSGGGMQTALAIIGEPRIAAAAPATFLSNRKAILLSGQAQDAEQIWPGMTASGFDHEDLLLAMAPRPVLVLAAQFDFFPIEGTKETVSRSHRFWELSGNAGGLTCFIDQSEHLYSPAMALQAALFFSKHLLGKDVNSVVPGVDESFVPAQFQCTVSGQIRGDNPGSRAVFEYNLDRAESLAGHRRAITLGERKSLATALLKDRVLAPRKVVDLNLQLKELPDQGEGFQIRRMLWCNEEKMHGHAWLVHSDNFSHQNTPITIAIWEGGTSRVNQHWNMIKTICNAGKTVMILDLSGEGALMPDLINSCGLRETFGTLHRLSTDLLWLNDSLAALRTYELLRAIEAATTLSPEEQSSINLLTIGLYGYYGQFASLLSEKIGKKTLLDRPISLDQWVKTRLYKQREMLYYTMPGILKVMDVYDFEPAVDSVEGDLFYDA